MKMQLLTACFVVLATSTQAFGQSCACDATPIAHHTHHVHHGDCHHCCDSCHNPLAELVEGIGFTLRNGACRIRNGVHRLFHPITFRGCGCHPQPSCGCGTTAVETYHHMPHEMEIIEQPRSQAPSVPGPPPVPTPSDADAESTEPARFQVPGKWQPSGSQGVRSGKPSLYYSRKAGTPSASPVTYYAPSRSK